MPIHDVGVDRRPGNAFLALLALGAVVAVAVLATGRDLGVFPLAAAVSALGIAVSALVLTQAVLLLGLHRRLGADDLAATTPYRPLLWVLGLGVLAAVGIAANGNQLGVFPIGAAVTALGVAVTVLALTTGWLLLALRREGILTVVPGQDAAKPTLDPWMERADAGPSDGATVPSRVGPTADGPLVPVDPVEEAEHVIRIEGIGEKYATRLNAHGIITIPQLRRADAADVARRIDATAEVVREWQAMGDLMRVRGIGPQSAEVLVRSGVTGVADLLSRSAEQVAQDVALAQAGRKVRLQGNEVRAGTVRRWIEAAREVGQPAVVGFGERQTDGERVRL